MVVAFSAWFASGFFSYLRKSTYIYEVIATYALQECCDTKLKV